MFHLQNDEPLLAYSLGNRSACLFRMEMYQDAIHDIQFALNGLHYPRDSVFKLYERMARSYMALHQPKEAEAVLKAGAKLVKNKEEGQKASQLMQSLR